MATLPAYLATPFLRIWHVFSAWQSGPHRRRLFQSTSGFQRAQTRCKNVLPAPRKTWPMKRNVYGWVFFFIYRHDDASDNSVPDWTSSFEWEAAHFKKVKHKHGLPSEPKLNWFIDQANKDYICVYTFAQAYCTLTEQLCRGDFALIFFKFLLLFWIPAALWRVKC